MTDIRIRVPSLNELRTRRAEILNLAERHGAYNVRVFGSVARGEATPESDIDLLVDMGEDADMFDLVGLWLDLQDLLGCSISLITDDEHPRHEHFMQYVREDAIAL